MDVRALFLAPAGRGWDARQGGRTLADADGGPGVIAVAAAASAALVVLALTGLQRNRYGGNR